MKKIICFLLVFSLLVSSVGAAEVYEVEPDTKVSLMSSVYDVMPLDITSSDLNTYLGTSSPLYTLFHSYWNQSGSFLMYLNSFFREYFGYSVGSTDNLENDFDSLLSSLSNLYSLIGDSGSGSTYYSPFWVKSGSYLNSSGASSAITASNAGLAEIVRSGFLGLKNVIENQSQYDYSTVLSQILTSVNNVDARLVTVDSSVGKVNTSLGQVNTSVGSVNTSVGHVNTSVGAVNSSLHSLLDSSSPLYSLLHDNLTVFAGTSMLASWGASYVTEVDWSPITLLTNGFLGLRSLIAGSAEGNVYYGSSIDNQNQSVSFSATGLGPMLHTWLGDIQNDLGVLSYVFASPQDLELKKESESNMDAVGETILSSDSKSSVKVKDITDISAASDCIQELGETGVTPGQAFEQLGNSDLFSFFSAETAANLDTTVSTYSRDPSQQIVTNYYQDNRLEFFDVIGKGVGW